MPGQQMRGQMPGGPRGPMMPGMGSPNMGPGGMPMPQHHPMMRGGRPMMSGQGNLPTGARPPNMMSPHGMYGPQGKRFHSWNRFRENSKIQGWEFRVKCKQTYS